MSPRHASMQPLKKLAKSKVEFLRERGYRQVAVVLAGPGGCPSVSNDGRVIWLKPPSELAITGAQQTEAERQQESDIPPNA